MSLKKYRGHNLCIYGSERNLRRIYKKRRGIDNEC